MIYWGCREVERAGHFVHAVTPTADGSRHSHDEWTRKLGRALDGGFAPKVQRQGAAALAEVNGFTVLAWHDYTGDSRPGSNSAIVVEGSHTLAEMLELLAKNWPDVAARQRTPWLA